MRNNQLFSGTWYLVTLSLVTLSLVMSGCNKNEPEQPAKVRTYHVSLQAGKGAAGQQNGPRRVLGLDENTLNATWQTGEQVSVRNITTGEDLSGYLVAQSDGEQTTLSGDLTGIIEAGNELELKFLSPDYTEQQGTLDYISSHCDYATATVQVASLSGAEITFTEGIAEFANQQAIVKFTLNDLSSNAINASSLVVEVNSATYAITLNPSASDIYVALLGFTEQTVTLTATAGSNTYTYTSPSAKTLANGKYYTITVGMTLLALTPHAFSISPTTKIEFSHGNLQYNGTTGAWRIAEHQYDYVGDNIALLTFGPDHSVGNVYDGGVKCSNETDDGTFQINTESWIDLLSWSSEDNTNPLNMSTNVYDFIGGGFKDWGEYEIYDPGKDITYPANTWYTLSIDQWYYIFFGRTNASRLFSLASIDGLTYGNVKGILILPDDFVMPAGLSFTPAEDVFGYTDGDSHYTYTSPAFNYDYISYSEQLEDPAQESNPDFIFNKNHYTPSQWAQLEAAGAVFLPAAGRRDRYPSYSMDFVIYTSIQANYWSSTLTLPTEPYYLGINPDNVNYPIFGDKSMAPYFGMSVRLVRNVE